MSKGCGGDGGGGVGDEEKGMPPTFTLTKISTSTSSSTHTHVTVLAACTSFGSFHDTGEEENQMLRSQFQKSRVGYLADRSGL